MSDEVETLRQLIFDMGVFEGRISDEQAALHDEIVREHGMCPRCGEELPHHLRKCPDG